MEQQNSQIDALQGICNILSSDKNHEFLKKVGQVIKEMKMGYFESLIMFLWVSSILWEQSEVKDPDIRSYIETFVQMVARQICHIESEALKDKSRYCIFGAKVKLNDEGQNFQLENITIQ
jgi:hypothetical protein